MHTLLEALAGLLVEFPAIAPLLCTFRKHLHAFIDQILRLGTGSACSMGAGSVSSTGLGLDCRIGLGWSGVESGMEWTGVGWSGAYGCVARAWVDLPNCSWSFL